MTSIQGDMLDIQTGILVHQVNCKKAMGAGLAKQLRNKYPKHYEDYMKTAPVLGNIVVSEITEDKLYVVGMYAQDGFGTHHQQTNYDAFRDCLKKLALIADEHSDYLQIFIPYKIGCGLAGGDWAIIEDMIEQELPDAIVVKREEDK